MKKELIILICYMNVDGMSRQHVEQSLLIVQENLSLIYRDDEYREFKLSIIPVTNQPTKIECIYPFNDTIPVIEEDNDLF